MIKRNFLYNSILSVSRIIFPLLSFPYVSRILGPAAIGKVNFIDSYTQYFCMMAALGIPIYGVREIARVRSEPRSMSRLVSELLILNVLASIVCSLIYFGVAIGTHKYETYGFLYWLGLMNLIMYSFLAEWFFQGVEQFKYVSIRSIGLNALSLVLIFTLVKSPEDVLWYYGIAVLTTGVNVLLNMYKLLTITKLSFNQIGLKRHLRPLVLLFSTQITISIYVTLDKVILGYLATSEYVGFYSAGQKIVKIFMSLIGALAVVLVPQMSKAFAERDDERIRSLYNKSSSFVITMSIPLCIGLMCLSNEIITLVSGKDFLPAATSLRIIAPIIFLIGLSNIYGIQILTANGKEKIVLKCTLIGMIVSVGLNFILSPILKHNGAALATLAAEFTVTLICGYFACKEINVGVDWKQISLTVLICVPFWFIHQLLMHFSSTTLVLLGTAFICAGYYALVQVFLVRNELWVNNFNSIKRFVIGKI